MGIYGKDSMLQIKNISKTYVTGELVQTALNDVSLTLRDNEFVAVLGHSGSGKTTLLNMIGGLDRYDSGDLIINGISTKKYRDRDWDSYRNHTIGFVFQSYNLIPHQSVLANVELALTISGIGRAERRRRAKEALEKVGLGDQLHKRPNQLSGGQMQRVAIARALVNDPKVLLADEPTGALDTDTSVQVMELLKEVASDRLVVMVTHNPELAETYATRIVRLKDGRITDDSDPVETVEDLPAEHRSMGRSSMSFLTALSLSFNNLRTKLGRTLLTAFAGSIGIIGIALILSLSTGVNQYITDIQKSTMLSYPISIEAQTIDLTGLVQSQRERERSEVTHEMNAVYSNGTRLEMVSSLTNSFSTNNLTAFKKYLDDPASEIHRYLGENGAVYSYDVDFSIYAYDPEGALVNTDGSTLRSASSGYGSMLSGMTGSMSRIASEMLAGQDGAAVSQAIVDSYELLYGTWPGSHNELVLVLDGNNELSFTALCQMGVLPVSEYREIMSRISAGEQVEVEPHSFAYADLCAKEFYLLPACDTFVRGADGYYSSVKNDAAELRRLVDGALKLHIVGVVKPVEDSDTRFLNSGLGYTRLLTDYLMSYTDRSPVVVAQRSAPGINVMNGMKFDPDSDEEKLDDVKTYLSGLGVTEKASMMRLIRQLSLFSGGTGQGTGTSQGSGTSQSTGTSQGGSAQTAPGSGFGGGSWTPGQSSVNDEASLAQQLDEYLAGDPDPKVLLQIYDQYVSAGTLDSNLERFGVVSADAPSRINLYADSFAGKDGISECIEKYNQTATEENKITYTDYVGLLMSSVTTIVNVISYVLIAFVAVSLVVSSIMIGIITYISVLERTKEIGILRAIGASKRNISNVFNAETFIVGLCAGLMGVGVTLLLLIPGNMLIHYLAESNDVNAFLPLGSALILIALSVVLTLIGGLIPSQAAARKDPVTALRTE